MKGLSKRFVNHRGKQYDISPGKRVADPDKDEKIGFFDLWRYAEPVEVILSVLGVLCAWTSSIGVAAAVLVYGQITSLFVSRTRLETPAPSSTSLLLPFGGARTLPPETSNVTLHMDELVADSLAFAWASVVIMLLQFVSAGSAVLLLNYAGNRMVNRIRAQLLRAVLRQEVAFFDTNTSLNLPAMLTEDVEKVRGGVCEHVAQCGYLSGAAAATAAVAIQAGWRLALSALALLPLSLLLAAFHARQQSRLSGVEVEAGAAAARGAQETLAALRTVRAYGGEREEIMRYGDLLSPVRKASNVRGAAAARGAGAAWALTYSLNAVVFAYGARLCVADMQLPSELREYNPGVMVTVLFCTFMTAQNIAMCNPHLELFSSARGAARALYRVLERSPAIDAMGADGDKPEHFHGNISFDNVYFNYPSRPDVKVLRGLTLSVSAGETVALVGGSGCGKSTVLQLLLRLYSPDSGTVSVDHLPLEKLNLHHFRTRIGVVGQEPVLFTGTVRDNIALGLSDEQASMEQIVEAATLANAHHFITKLAKGYDTHLGEGGASLSGGQKQRIAIARAVIRKPSILLLDEPTSALDPLAERQVQAALDAASAGRTTIVVSHRLSTIVNASRIVYMEQGAVLEQGTYSELLEKKGLFWQLLQADMTSQCVTSPPPSTEEEDDDVIEEGNDTFQRGFQRQDTLRESLTPERVIRGSRRFSSMTRLAATNDHLDHAIPTESDLESDPAESSVSTWDLIKLNAPEWPLLLGGGLASLFIGATMPLFAWLFSNLYGMFTWSDTSAIVYWSSVYAGVFAAAAAACGALTSIQGALLATAGSRLTQRLRHRVFTSYLAQEQAWFDRPENSVGALCARLSADCAAVQGATGSRLATMLQGISTMTIGVALAAAYSWKMTLVSLIAVPVVIGAIYLEGLVSRRTELRERRALEAAAAAATEAVLALRTVHTLGIESTIISRYTSALSSSCRNSALPRVSRGAVYGLCLCAPTLGYALSLAYGGYLVARDRLPLHYTILVSEALIYGAWMLAEALSFAPNFAAARRAGARVIAQLRREPRLTTQPISEQWQDWVAKGDIEFKNVTFTFPTRNVPSLRSLSLSAPAGLSAALVGGSGAGKSTVLLLLLRMYDPDCGVVTLDGHDIRDIPLPVLRRQFALVQQQPALFARSIRDNIAYAAPSATLHDVIQAAKQANVHTFISSLPAGYDTVLGGGGGGAQLSGGQRQRVCLARALLRHSPVLLLDEPTSALDAHSEQVVQSALESACSGRSALSVAHRLATVSGSHQILVFHKGSVVESGTHEELLKADGTYSELWKQQAGATH